MLIELGERSIIHILNALNVLMYYYMYHPTNRDYQFIKNFYNYDNYADMLDEIKLIHRRISCKANEEYYHLQNNVFFEGQKNFLKSRNKKL